MHVCGSKAAGFVFTPTEREKAERFLHLRYSSVRDEYCRLSNGAEVVHTWDRCLWTKESVIRKVEQDWGMVGPNLSGWFRAGVLHQSRRWVFAPPPGLPGQDRRLRPRQRQLEVRLPSSRSEDKIRLHRSQKPDLSVREGLLASAGWRHYHRVPWRYRNQLSRDAGRLLTAVLCLTLQTGARSRSPPWLAPRSCW